MKAWPRYATVAAFFVVLAFLVLVYGYRWGLWGLGAVFGAMQGFTFALLAAAALAFAAAGALAFRRSFFATFAALAVAISAGVFGVLPLWMKSTAAKVPPIHDITTDTANPPEFAAIAPLRADAPNPAAYDTAQTAQQMAAYPDLRPLVMPKPLPEAYGIALEVVREAGLELVASTPSEGRIEATETVPLFGFKDDVVIRLRNAHNIATVIDIRSKSRVGRSDLGFNARRVRDLIERMEEKGGRLEPDGMSPEEKAI